MTKLPSNDVSIDEFEGEKSTRLKAFDDAMTSKNATVKEKNIFLVLTDETHFQHPNNYMLEIV